jgi:putative ABC transport system substrate-binding protein
MKRREFIALLGGSAAWPLAARAQQERMRRVGVLLGFAESDSEAKAWVGAFEEGLQKLGWSQGRNLRIDYRWAGNDEARLRSYAAELVGAAPDVIFSATGLALVALKRETRSLPIHYRLYHLRIFDRRQMARIAQRHRTRHDPGGGRFRSA